MFKKRVSTAALALLMMSSTNAYGASAPQFSDFPSDWSAKSLTWSVKNNLLSGTNDGKIEPKGAITRAQMAAIASRAFAAQNKTALDQFTDVDSDAWYYDGLSKAVAMGAMSGSDGKLNPNAPISRQEAFSVLARIFSLDANNPTTLEKFQDNDQVATWAKQATAALVEKNYISGDGASLHPTSNITRAEMMHIMHNMIGTYEVAGDNHVNGNLVLRDSNANLQGTTIDGDLILADGAKNVNLDGVTVKGSVLVRGGSEQVTIKNTNVNQITVAQRANVTVESGTIGNIDIEKTAEQSNLHIEKDATVSEIHASANNVTIDGDGHVEHVQVDASDVVVSTPNTKVDGSEQTTGAINSENKENKEKETANQTDKKPNTNNNSSSGSGNSTNHRPHRPQTKKIVKEAKVVDLGWSRHMVVSLEDGKNLENCTFEVDGVDVTSAVTPVTDDGSIVKWEAVNLQPSKLVVTHDKNTQTVTFENGTGVAPTVQQDTTPDYFLLNGPVQIWDYHLTNYDENGNIRRNPKKTTFDLSEKKNDIRFYSPDADLIENDEHADNIYGVSGTVKVMFNYEGGTEAERAFVDGITDVDLVAYNENKNTLNDELTYTIDKNFTHNDKTVACIQIPLGQRNFYTNGRYNIRVTSNGTAKLFPIHVVQQTVPSMQLSEDKVVCGQNVHFHVKDMVYGATMPVYRVDLKDPNGKVHALNKIDEYYLIGDLFVLYNDINNHTEIPGKYTVTVYADGFHAFSKDFLVKDGKSVDADMDMEQDSIPFDAVSSASVGGGGSDGGSGGGSTVMNANLIINSDLLINAEILKDLGVKNAYVDGITERWETMSHLYVFNEGAQTVYTANGYFDAVQQAELNGSYLTFAEYIQSEQAETTPNRPYTVKQVLEDNLLGETVSFSESSAKPAPDFREQSKEQNSITFVSDDAQYMQALKENGVLQLDNGYAPLGKDAYTVTENTLTLKNVKTGKHDLTIKVDGYQTVKLSFVLDKTLEEVNLTTKKEISEKEDIVVTCENTAHINETCDFFANITKVVMTAPNGQTRTVSRYNTEAIGLGYRVDKNTLTIDKSIFNEKFAQDTANNTVQSGTYTIRMTAQGYGEKEVSTNVTVENNVNPQPEENKKPLEISKMELHDSILPPSYYRVSFTTTDEAELKAYLEAINTITANDEVLQNESNFWNVKKAYHVSNHDSFGYVCYLDFTDDCFNKGTGAFTVVVSADGYQDLTFKVSNGALGDAQTPEPEPEQPEPQPQPDENGQQGGDTDVNGIDAPALGEINLETFFTDKFYRLSFDTDDEKAMKAYAKALESENATVKVDNEVLTKKSGFWGNDTKSYKISSKTDGITRQYIDFTEDCFPKNETVSVEISVNGYKTVKFKVANGTLVKENTK